MRYTAIPLVMAMVLAGCTTTSSPARPSDSNPQTEGRCKAAEAQSFVGQKATDEIGAAILENAGAKTLRWGPPRGAWTMDYRQDRVNVRYDDDMTITAVTCG